MFQEVNLRKDGWYYRLQEWTFGKVPFKNNFCPFFWLTIFCILASPFVGLYKSLSYLAINIGGLLLIAGGIIGSGIEKFLSFLDDKICKPIYDNHLESRVDNMDEDEAYNLFEKIFIWVDGKPQNQHFNYKFFDLSNKKRKKYLDIWKKWESKWDEEKWKEILESRRKKLEEAALRRAELRRRAEEKKVEEVKKAKERAEARARRQQAAMTALAKYTKYLVILPAGIIGIYVLYYMGVLALLVMENWNSIVEVLRSIVYVGGWGLVYTAGVAASLATLISVAIFIALLIKKCMLWLPPIPKTDMPNFRRLLIPFSWFLYHLKKVFYKIGSAIESTTNFFIIYFKAFKENNCPAIKWEDD